MVAAENEPADGHRSSVRALRSLGGVGFGAGGLLHHLEADAVIRGRVRKAVYWRLGRLNEYLNDQVDRQLKKDLDPVVPDTTSLLALKSVVDQAASPRQLLSRRELSVRVGELILGVQIAASLIVAGATAFAVAPDLVSSAGRLGFGVGMTITAVCLLIALWTGMLIDRVLLEPDLEGQQ